MITRTIFTFLLTLLLAFNIKAQNGYNFKIKIEGFNQKEIYLGYFYGDKQYLRDTTQVDDKGYFTFQGKEELPGGVYLIVMPPDNQWFQLLLSAGEQNFTIETALPDLAGNVKVKGSKDNELLYKYLDFLNQKRAISEKINNELKIAKEANQNTESITKELELLNQEVVTYQKSIVDKYPKTLSAMLVKANMPLDEPKEFAGETQEDKEINRWRWNQKHYFDNMDLTDPRMLRTPFLFKSLTDYVDKMVVQHPDTIALAVERVLNLVKPAEETFKYYLIHFLNKYAASNIIGMDAVYVHIVEQFYAKGLAPWTEKEQLEKIIDNANNLKPTLIGKIAPDIILQTRDKKEIALHDVVSPYTIILVWDPDCGHCKKSMPDMKKFYEAYKDKGVQVFAICNKSWEKDENGGISLKEVEKCWDYIDKNDYDGWLNVVDPFNRSRYKSKYFIQSTPQIFILDKDKKIISKRLASEQLTEVMDQIIKMDEKKLGLSGK